MFCRTHKSFGIESLEKRELLAADLLAMDRLDPDGTDQTIQNVCQIEAKMLTVSDPTANGPTVDPFGTDSVQFQTATGEEPDGTRRIKPHDVDDTLATYETGDGRVDPMTYLEA